MPFSRNLRFSHTMATDSSDQLNLNPTTTTKENPKQTLDDNTTTTAVRPTKLPRRRRRGRTNRWGFRLAFCNRRRFRCEVQWGFKEFVRYQERYDLHGDRNREKRLGQRHREWNRERGKIRPPEHRMIENLEGYRDYVHECRCHH